jgi:hypothetical protein
MSRCPIGSLQEAARAAKWKDPSHPGKWVKVTRTFRDGSTQDCWALEVVSGPYGPDKPQRAVIATTDPLTLPDLTTFYLVTNLPAPGSQPAQDSDLAVASLEEVVRLYGLRMWVEQSYKQVKHALGWSQYQVRSDKAMRRHWQLVCCAFSFCWYHSSHPAESTVSAEPQDGSPTVWPPPSASGATARAGEKNQHRSGSAATDVLASRTASGPRMALSLDHAQTVLERVVITAPTSCLATAAPVS